MRPRCLTPPSPLPVLIAPLKMQYRCMNIIWHPHDHHLARYSYLYNRLGGQWWWSSSKSRGVVRVAWLRKDEIYVFPPRFSRRTDTPSPPPRVSTCVEGYQRLHLARKAMIISRCTHKNWLAWRAVACPPSRGSFAAPPPFRWRVVPFRNVALESSRPSFDARSPATWLETAPLLEGF